MCLKTDIANMRGFNVNSVRLALTGGTPQMAFRGNGNRVRITISYADGSNAWPGTSQMLIGYLLNGQIIPFGAIAPHRPSLTLNVEDFGPIFYEELWAANNSGTLNFSVTQVLWNTPGV